MTTLADSKKKRKKMRFKVGDKVRFLNEKGGGTIVSVMDSQVVKLETDDGFEMPVMVKELIPDYRFSPDEDVFVAKTAAHAPEPKEPEPESNISEINPWGRPKEEEGIYWVFEPHEQQWVLTGDMDVVLVNHTPFDIIYSLFLEQDGVMKGVDYNTVPSASKIVIDTISRDDIEKFTRGAIQLLIADDEPTELYYPIHSVLDIRSGRFYKEGSYKQNTLVNKKAIVSVVALRSTFKVAGMSEQERKSDAKPQKTALYEKREKPFIEKHRSAQGEAIVDLHIGEIIDNIAGLSSYDMLMLQMNYFRKALESAMSEEYRKVTFIHGVGNGTLKNNIIKELEIYSNTEQTMASVSKFGVGALDVSIKRKED